MRFDRHLVRTIRLLDTPATVARGSHRPQATGHEQGADRQAGRPLQAADGTPISLGPGVELRPQIAEKGPFPKAVVGNDVYGFGRMSINEEKKHTFRIENKGQVPLVLAKGPTECKCISAISPSMRLRQVDLPKLT